MKNLLHLLQNLLDALKIFFLNFQPYFQVTERNKHDQIQNKASFIVYYERTFIHWQQFKTFYCKTFLNNKNLTIIFTICTRKWLLFKLVVDKPGTNRERIMLVLPSFYSEIFNGTFSKFRKLINDKIAYGCFCMILNIWRGLCCSDRRKEINVHTE